MKKMNILALTALIACSGYVVAAETTEVVACTDVTCKVAVVAQAQEEEVVVVVAAAAEPVEKATEVIA